MTDEEENKLWHSSLKASVQATCAGSCIVIPPILFYLEDSHNLYYDIVLCLFMVFGMILSFHVRKRIKGVEQ